MAYRVGGGFRQRGGGGRPHTPGEDRVRRGYRDVLRTSLEGKRLFVVTQSYQIDWVLNLALDLGMDIVKVGVLASSWDEGFATRYEGRFPLAVSYTREQRDDGIRTLAPDLTLTNAVWRGRPG